MNGLEFHKHTGIDEIIFVLRKGNKYVSWYEPIRHYKYINDINYDEYIKELLYKKLLEL